jgi:hypothetical protein
VAHAPKREDQSRHRDAECQAAEAERCGGSFFRITQPEGGDSEMAKKAKKAAKKKAKKR